MYLSAANTLSFATNSAQQFFINSSGNTGFGLEGTASAGRIHARGDIISQTNLTSSGAFFFQSRKSRGTISAPTVVAVGDDVGGLILGGYDGSTYRFGAGVGSKVISVSAGSLVNTLLLSAGNGNQFDPAATLRMTVRGDTGNILINSTTDTGQKLQVTGTAIVSSSITGASFIPTASTVPTNGMYLSNTNEISFATNSTQIINVNSSGNTGMGIGGTTPSARLHVSGDVISQTSLNITQQFWFNSRKSRGTVAAPLSVNVGDDAGGILFTGYNGTSWLSGAAISGQVQAVSGSTLSSNLRLYAGNGSASVGTLRMILRGDTGNILINQTTDTGERLQVTGTVKTTDSITTGAPTTGTAAPWKFGSRVAAAVVLDSTQYIELDISGTLYKLAIVT
jgi:hypothetical protein